MRNIKQYVSVLLILSILLPLSGCWNYREVESLVMVSGFAIDKGQNGYKYHITYEFLDLSNDKMGSKLIESDGDSIFDCARKAVGKIGKKLYFSDCKLVVMSKEIASGGILTLTDWLMRDTEPRININLAVSGEKTAADILRLKPIANPLVGLEMWQALEKNISTLGEAPDIKLYEVNNVLAAETDSLILPLLISSTDSKEKTAEFGGTAIFKDDRMVGYLNRDETKYLLMIRGQLKGGLLLTSMKDNNKDITLEISECKTKLAHSMTDQELSMDVSVNIKAFLAEDDTDKNYASIQGLDQIKESAKNTLDYGITTLVKKVQSEYGSDIFGFASSIHRTDPDLWKKLKPDWDKEFKNLKITASSKVSILDTATRRTKSKEG